MTGTTTDTKITAQLGKLSFAAKGYLMLSSSQKKTSAIWRNYEAQQRVDEANDEKTGEIGDLEEFC